MPLTAVPGTAVPDEHGTDFVPLGNVHANGTQGNPDKETRAALRAEGLFLFYAGVHGKSLRYSAGRSTVSGVLWRPGVFVAVTSKGTGQFSSWGKANVRRFSVSGAP